MGKSQKDKVVKSDSTISCFLLKRERLQAMALDIHSNKLILIIVSCYAESIGLLNYMKNIQYS